MRKCKVQCRCEGDAMPWYSQSITEGVDRIASCAQGSRLLLLHHHQAASATTASSHAASAVPVQCRSAGSAISGLFVVLSAAQPGRPSWGWLDEISA